MILTEIRDIDKTVIQSLTAAEFATWQGKLGKNIVEHQGNYWQETVIGFYEPIHWLARFRSPQATNPTPLSWGFRVTLSEDEVNAANASMPIHLLPNLKNYDLQTLNTKRRSQIRKCRNLVKIVELTSPIILQEQGYEVVVSGLTRTAYTKPPLKDEYLKEITKYFYHKGHLVLAGFIGEKLGGYIGGYVVDGTAYIETTMIATEALSTNIGSGLIFEFAQICRRSSEVHELINGLHSRENESLCVFKQQMGFEVKYVPAKVQMNSIIENFIKWKYPHKYYRLTGWE